MKISKTSMNLALVAWLWVLVGLVCFLMAVQGLLLIYSPKGTWHLPRIYKVTIRDFDNDPQSAYATLIIGREYKNEEGQETKGAAEKAPAPAPKDVHPGSKAPHAKAKSGKGEEEAKDEAEDADSEDNESEEPRDITISILQAERKGLSVGEDLWVMDNYYRTPVRPPQFRLTPMRLLLEFPEPLLIVALLLILRIRRTQARVAKEEQETPRERTILVDDFHRRAVVRQGGEDAQPPEDAGPKRES